ncbi:hypothetical protein BJ138DRAFT_1148795 [Hygrophoropsis aurantiaca]|uniref:Uncharacterized protein n=1 Tax=Hygrophoropsis aurantiaca TaxID=72124 RepID=A0ACB8AGD2_9AGAM|nr:hypothetical protein BJ138DRAFT_1148795 [Hygrophoropsis aurantiaca]
MSLPSPSANDFARPDAPGHSIPGRHVSIRTSLVRQSSERDVLPRMPAPRYRHATPSGPWPWMDLNSDLPSTEPPSADLSSSSWRGYPQSLFGNWTPDQVKRSKMLISCARAETSTIYKLDVMEGGQFEVRRTDIISKQNEDEYWQSIQEEKRPENICIRALFVDNMTLPVLRMLGTKYNVEPFFFSSSVNWIPSRYQEDVQPGRGDHITITLPFIRTILNDADANSLSSENTSSSYRPQSPPDQMHSEPGEDEEIIDTQAPLLLRPSGHILLLDLLSLHMIRSTESSTMISYHPTANWGWTSAKRLHALVYTAGQSVYWNKLYKQSNDPTLVLLATLWYALYAWDEAFEVLYTHINGLESRVISTNDMRLTRELHVIQAHLLHYQTLLQDFQKSVAFVSLNPNPALSSPFYTSQEQEHSNKLLKTECDNLLSEIDRLEGRRSMQTSRMKNVMNLAFASIKIEDSRSMRDLTEAAVHDSATTKRISYLTMVFLPASLIAGVFGMNVKEIQDGSRGTLGEYAESTVVMTVLTAWIVVAVQTNSPLHASQNATFWQRIAWPVLYAQTRLRNRAVRIKASELGEPMVQFPESTRSR